MSSLFQPELLFIISPIKGKEQAKSQCLYSFKAFYVCLDNSQQYYFFSFGKYKVVY